MTTITSHGQVFILSGKNAGQVIGQTEEGLKIFARWSKNFHASKDKDQQVTNPERKSAVDNTRYADTLIDGDPTDKDYDPRWPYDDEGTDESDDEPDDSTDIWDEDGHWEPLGNSDYRKKWRD